LSLGFILGISGLVTLFNNYLFSVFITKFGNFEQLGFYSAGIAITTNYTGLLFSAIAIDYHPRLVSLTDNSLVKRAVNQQAEIGLIILTPLILTFIVFGDFFINLLYSESFLKIKPMICLILLGTFFKLFSWSISFTFVARGMVKLFFWNELAANTYVLFFSCFGFYFYGLNGIGIAFVISFLVYSIQVYFLARKHFNFSYGISFIKGFVFQFVMACISYFGLERIEAKYSYLLGTLIIIASVFYSLWELDKKMQLKSFFKLNR
jgi:O-antigen/teichoic acid export membrane protein